MALEYENPIAWGAVHHLTVTCYMLQHNAYSGDVWLEARKMLAQFIQEGHFEAHLRRMRRVYRARRTALLEALARELGNLAEPGPNEAGLYLLVRLAPGIDEGAVAQRAAKLGVAVYSAEPYYQRPVERPGLVLGYAALDEAQIREGIRRLARAIRSM